MSLWQEKENREAVEQKRPPKIYCPSCGSTNLPYADDGSSASCPNCKWQGPRDKLAGPPSVQAGQDPRK